MKFRKKSVTTKKIIVKPRYEEWRLIIGQLGISVLWTWQLLDLGFQFLPQECVVFWILCHQPFVIFFCLASGFWFWTCYCAFLQFWAILLASDISNRPHKKPKSKIHFPRRGDKYPPSRDFPQGCV